MLRLLFNDQVTLAYVHLYMYSTYVYIYIILRSRDLRILDRCIVSCGSLSSFFYLPFSRSFGFSISLELRIVSLKLLSIKYACHDEKKTRCYAVTWCCTRDGPRGSCERRHTYARALSTVLFSAGCGRQRRKNERHVCRERERERSRVKVAAIGKVCHRKVNVSCIEATDSIYTSEKSPQKIEENVHVRKVHTRVIRIKLQAFDRTCCLLVHFLRSFI